MTSDQIPEEVAAPRAHPRRSSSRASRLGGLLSPLSPAPIYLGITLTIAGFGLLTYTWSRVAGTAIVALQLPFIASGGFAGLGLIIVGVVAINLGAKRRDAWQRERRLDELAEILEGTAASGRPEEDAPSV